MVVREVKGRPELRTQPGLVEIPTAAPGHARRRVFDVLHRLLELALDRLHLTRRRVQLKER